MSRLFGLTYFIALPVLVAQWVGVVMIGRSGRRGGGWWCMLAGAILDTLAMVATPVVYAVVLPRLVSASGAMPVVAYVSVGLGLLSGAGSLLFMIGFAVHAMGFRGVCERVAELGMIVEAQQEQLTRGR